MEDKDKKETKDRGLEKVVVRPLKPIVDQAVHKFLGITIDELSKDISDKIETKPLIKFDVDINLSFKVAKKMFKKQFFSELIQTHYGNVSEVADIASVNRRSIHRVINDLGIDVKKLRKEMLMPTYYTKEAVDSILKDTLDNYKEILHPSKLEKMYKHVSTVSEDILKALPSKDLTWKQAEKEFEKEYLTKVLREFGTITKVAKKIKIRYETLIRKLKKLGLR
jgi:DNA-binding NtrC family response regulator